MEIYIYIRKVQTSLKQNMQLLCERDEEKMRPLHCNYGFFLQQQNNKRCSGVQM